MNPNLMNRIVNIVLNTSYDALDDSVKQHTKLVVLDWIGCALAGSTHPKARSLARLVKKLGGLSESTVIGTDIKTSSPLAALANGFAGHVMELDDMHEGALMHPAAPVVPAALAVAESSDARGSDLMLAIVIGYEVESRLGRAVNPSHYRFWHTTGTCGTFGAAAAAGRLLNLSRSELVNAFGIAGTLASGLVVTFGTDAKYLNPAHAAMSGIMAALLAREGFSGPEDILDSDTGFLKATSDSVDASAVVDRTEEKFEILNNTFKLHASCGHTHAGVEAVLHLRSRHGLTPSNVEKILVRTYPIAIELTGRNYEPRTMHEAMFSYPYCIAVALKYGKVSLNEFSEDKLKNEELLELAKKVVLEIEPEYAGVGLGKAKVIVYMKNGKTVSHAVEALRGSPQNPAGIEDITAKFKDLARIALPEEAVARVASLVSSLDKLSNVKELTRELVTTPRE
ncbi:MAG: MmgE/PrpD family protein [Desulfurococcaceae archaeon]